MEKTCPDCGHSYDSEATPKLKGGCPKCVASFLVDPTEVMDTAGFAKSKIPGMAPFDVGDVYYGMTILEFLGQGGMGYVYKAKQSKLDRVVALKILDPKLAAAPEFTSRFDREAKALAALNHPNIVQVYDFGHEDDYHYLTMEFIDGVTLRQVMTTQRVEPKTALRYVPQICDALEYAHSQGVIHRDIKPENILMDKQGNLKIADFGLAKMNSEENPLTQITLTGQVMGTPNYMAPEQRKEMATVDHRADIYSLGVVFYEMLTGELPIGRFAMPSESVSIDVRLDDVVLKALEADPQRRYQHASQIKADIRKTDARKIGASKQGKPESEKSGVKRALVAVLGGAAALILIPIAILVFVFLVKPGAAKPSYFPIQDTGREFSAGIGQPGTDSLPSGRAKPNRQALWQGLSAVVLMPQAAKDSVKDVPSVKSDLDFLSKAYSAIQIADVDQKEVSTSMIQLKLLRKVVDPGLMDAILKLEEPVNLQRIVSDNGKELSPEDLIEFMKTASVLQPEESAADADVSSMTVSDGNVVFKVPLINKPRWKLGLCNLLKAVAGSIGPKAIPAEAASLNLRVITNDGKLPETVTIVDVDNPANVFTRNVLSVSAKGSDKGSAAEGYCLLAGLKPGKMRFRVTGGNYDQADNQEVTLVAGKTTDYIVSMVIARLAIYLVAEDGTPCDGVIEYSLIGGKYGTVTTSGRVKEGNITLRESKGELAEASKFSVNVPGFGHYGPYEMRSGKTLQRISKGVYHHKIVITQGK